MFGKQTVSVLALAVNACCQLLYSCSADRPLPADVLLASDPPPMVGEKLEKSKSVKLTPISYAKRTMKSPWRCFVFASLPLRFLVPGLIRR